MGRPKMLLPWSSTSVLGHLIAQWRRLGALQVAVVCGAADRAIADELDRLEFPAGDRIRNPAPEMGMFSSIQCAARWPGWNREVTHWALVLGDQPHLRFDTLQELLTFATAHRQNICQPARRGRPRHPVLLPAAIFAQLGASTDSDLNQFLQRRPEQRALCEIDDDGLDLDLDTPADYERAAALSQTR